MKKLNSYWRVEYINNPDRSQLGNLFKELPKQDDASAYILFRSIHNYIVMNRYPYNAGHIMVVPYREVSDLRNMTTEEKSDHMEMIIKGQDILHKAIHPHGYNIGYNIGEAGGAGVPTHIHCHIVPRWKGDTNFMPVLGETSVLTEAMDSMWKRLREFV
jgi:ATP adenylyltransferase